MEEKKYLHIGIGKSGSTVLQKDIFPIISETQNLQYIDIYKFFTVYKKNILSNEYHALENIKSRSLPSSFLISNESLIGRKWEFYKFKKAKEINLYLFGGDCNVLIFVRKPSELLSSIYTHFISRLLLIDQKLFFINKSPEDLETKDNIKYNLYNFNYQNLIDLYKSSFKKVYVIKYEDIKKMQFLNDIFEVDEKQKLLFLELVKRNVRNKSLSGLSVKTILLISSILNVDYYKLYTKKEEYKKIRFILSTIIKALKIIDKYNPFYKKFSINVEKMPIDIDNLDRQYSKTL